MLGPAGFEQATKGLPDQCANLALLNCSPILFDIILTLVSEPLWSCAQSRVRKELKKGGGFRVVFWGTSHAFGGKLA